jgi:hypothetical protein
MARPRGKKTQPQHPQHRTERQETTKSRDKPQHDPVGSDRYSNHREPCEDTESVEEVFDEDSIPDIFKGRKKARSSHIWLPENGEDYTFGGVTRWKCQRCKSPKFAKYQELF